MLRNLLRSPSGSEPCRIARRARPELTCLEGRQLLSGIIGQHIGASVEIKHIGVDLRQGSHIDIQGYHLG
jgi:hypothetical protein